MSRKKKRGVLAAYALSLSLNHGIRRSWSETTESGHTFMELYQTTAFELDGVVYLSFI
jgi:hypothetical protein